MVVKTLSSNNTVRALQSSNYHWNAHPLATTNTPVPPFDLNTYSTESNSKEDHSIDDSGSSSCELTKLVKVGCDVGFQFSKDDPIVTGIANLGDSVKMQT